MISLLAGVINAPAVEVSTAPVPPPHYITLSWMALGICAASVLTWLIFRWRNAGLKRRLNSPRRLWRDLARLQRLNWSEQRLLSHLARKLKVANPARLFLEEDLWKQACTEEKITLRRKQIVALHAKVIGQRVQANAG
jgi:hypothetical protein